ncbi:hypothetical protein ABZU45_34325, partial [Streptomyces avermitilis]
TAPSGLAAAGIEPVLLPPAPQPQPQLEAADAAAVSRAAEPAPVPQQAAPQGNRPPEQPEYSEVPGPDQSPWFQAPQQQVVYEGGYDPSYEPEEAYEQWYEEQGPERYEPGPEETGSFPIPAGPGGRTRQLGEGGGTESEQLPIPAPRAEPDEEAYYQVFRQSINGSLPTPREFGDSVEATFGRPLPDNESKRMVNRFSNRFNAELEEDHIA